MPSSNVGTGDQFCPCINECDCNLAATSCCCNVGCRGGPAGDCIKCGCTDKAARNWDPEAEIDDCACLNNCHHTTGHPDCSGTTSFDIKKIKTKRAALEGYPNLIGPGMLIIDELLDI